MKMTFTIENKGDAQEALNVIAAYLGEEKAETKEVQEVEKTTTKKKKVEVDEKDELDNAEQTSDKITLAELTALAKKTVARVDKDAVKEVISEFGEKLSAVDEADYEELSEKLKAL